MRRAAGATLAQQPQQCGVDLAGGSGRQPPLVPGCEHGLQRLPVLEADARKLAAPPVATCVPL
jgi:hypothetical protein